MPIEQHRRIKVINKSIKDNELGIIKIATSGTDSDRHHAPPHATLHCTLTWKVIGEQVTDSGGVRGSREKGVYFKRKERGVKIRQFRKCKIELFT